MQIPPMLLPEAEHTEFEWIYPARRYHHHLTADSPVNAAVNRHASPTALEFDVHREIEVGILLTGAMERRCGSLARLVEPGEVWLCGMWEPHGWRATAADTQAALLLFLPSFLGDERLGETPWLSLFAATPEERPRVRTAETRETMLAIAQEVEKEAREVREGRETALRLCLLRVLLALWREWEPPQAVTAPKPPHASGLSRILPALEYLHDALEQHVTLDAAAERCGLSRSHFSLLFRQCMGISFAKFQMRARLSQVARQLLTTDSSLDSIAERTGFANSSHLHAAFTKQFGCTPATYRRQAG